MTIKLSVVVRNARLEAVETAVGASAVLKIRSGAPPTNIVDADSGSVLATFNLDADWMANAAAGAKAKAGTWEDASADADGTAGHFRVYASDGTTQHVQGTCGDVGTEDLVLDNAVIAITQQVTINTFTLTDGNA